MEIPEENGEQRGPRNKRLLVLVGIAVLVLVAAVVYTAVVYLSPRGTEGPPEVGALAPDFEVPTLNNETVELSAFRGQPVLLNISCSN